MQVDHGQDGNPGSQDLAEAGGKLSVGVGIALGYGSPVQSDQQPVQRQGRAQSPGQIGSQLLEGVAGKRGRGHAVGGQQRDRLEPIFPGALEESAELVVGVLPAFQQSFPSSQAGVLEVLVRRGNGGKTVGLMKKSGDADALHGITLARPGRLAGQVRRWKPVCLTGPPIRRSMSPLSMASAISLNTGSTAAA